MFNFDAFKPLTDWLSPTERRKAKRIKLDKLKEQKAELLQTKCTLKQVQRLAKLNKQIANLERDLVN